VPSDGSSTYPRHSHRTDEVIGAIDDEIRGIVARYWPHLLEIEKLPPPKEINLAR
jgi:hypothetical protein